MQDFKAKNHSERAKVINTALINNYQEYLWTTMCHTDSSAWYAGGNLLSLNRDGFSCFIVPVHNQKKIDALSVGKY
jgi:hypothetical protein